MSFYNVFECDDCGITNHDDGEHAFTHIWGYDGAEFQLTPTSVHRLHLCPGCITAIREAAQKLLLKEEDNEKETESK